MARTQLVLCGALAVVLCLSVCAAERTMRVKLHHRKEAQHRFVQQALAGQPSAVQGNVFASNPIDRVRNIGDGEYVANMTIGTPPQQFSLIMDTGSGNIWAPGIQCKSAGCSQMSKFDQTKSSTFVDLKEPFLLVYGTGSCYGDLSNESIGTAPPGEDGAVIVNQTWGYATEVAKFFEQVPDADGIWGLGLPMTQVPDTITPAIDNMVSQGIISRKLFSVYLDSGMGDDNSEILWGGIDNTKYTGELFTQRYREFPPGKLIYYMMDWTEMTFNGQKVAGEGCSELLPCMAVVDTGTSVLLGPTETVNKINAALNIAADCSNFGHLPDLVIKVPGDRTLSIPSSVYIIKDPVAGNCTSGIIGTPVYQGFWIFGDPFLRAVYTVFDNDNNAFSFGQSVGPSKIQL